MMVGGMEDIERRSIEAMERKLRSMARLCG